MEPKKVAYIARSETDTALIEHGLEGLDYELEIHVVHTPGEVIEAIKGADVILNGGIEMTKEIIDEIDTAQAIIVGSHGFNHIDHEAATEKGVMIINCAGFCTEEVSNHAIVMVLACAKKLTILHNLMQQGKWGPETRAAIMPMAPIDGQTLGLVGFGNIARAVARKAHAFGMKVLAYDPYVGPWIAREYFVELAPSLDELASRSDFVSVHVPLNPQTRHLIKESFFQRMKQTAYFVNTCRGATVDEAALIKALQTGQIAGAGLDVFEVEPTPADNPLLHMENVIVTPHSAGTSNNSRVRSPLRVGQETARVLNGRWPMSLVNPEVRAKLEMRPLGTNVYGD
jgi:D-3-phosphoglycerate dehydrogenase